MKKRVVIFGATGGTGQELIRQGLQNDYAITAFVRNPLKLNVSDEKLNVCCGNVLNYQAVLGALNNQDAVFCALGAPASDKSLLRTDGTINIVRAMKETGTSRLICQASLGYGDSREMLPWYMKRIIVPLMLKHAFEDHQKQEAVIEKSSLDWTIVRPANLTNGSRTEIYKHGFSNTERIKLSISRADVAHFMLGQINTDRYLHQKPGVSY